MCTREGGGRGLGAGDAGRAGSAGGCRRGRGAGPSGIRRRVPAWPGGGAAADEAAAPRISVPAGRPAVCMECESFAWNVRAGMPERPASRSPPASMPCAAAGAGRLTLALKVPAARFPTPRSRNEASAFCSLSGSIARRCGQFSPAPPSAAPAPLPTSGFAKFLRKYTSRMWFVRGEFAKLLNFGKNLQLE